MSSELTRSRPPRHPPAAPRYRGGPGEEEAEPFRSARSPVGSPVLAHPTPTPEGPQGLASFPSPPSARPRGPSVCPCARPPSRQTGRQPCPPRKGRWSRCSRRAHPHRGLAQPAANDPRDRPRAQARQARSPPGRGRRPSSLPPPRRGAPRQLGGKARHARPETMTRGSFSLLTYGSSGKWRWERHLGIAGPGRQHR